MMLEGGKKKDNPKLFLLSTHAYSCTRVVAHRLGSFLFSEARDLPLVDLETGADRGIAGVAIDCRY